MGGIGVFFSYLRCLCYRKHLSRTKVNNLKITLSEEAKVYTNYNYSHNDYKKDYTDHASSLRINFRIFIDII
jgi:hypothetical protein